MDSMINDTSIVVPIGSINNITKFSIKCVQSKRIKPIELMDGCETNKFIALFDENDVDFEICCDNRECNRGIGLDLIFNDKQCHQFYIPPKKLNQFKALETNGRKLHFISQNTVDGRIRVKLIADKYGISYDMASIICSKIQFRIEVEKNKNNAYVSPFNSVIGSKIKLFVKTLTGKTITIDIGLNNTVYELKTIIQDREGIPPDQQRLFFGELPSTNKLVNDMELAFYNIQNKSTVYLVLDLRGGGCAPPLTEITDDTSHLVNNKTDSHAINTSKRNTKSIQSQFSGERGVICYGEKSNEKFTDYHDFKADPNIKLNPFVIEMRMKPKYAII